MGNLLKGTALVLVFIVVTAAGITVYHFSTMSTFQLIAAYMDEGSPTVIKWSAKQTLYAFHPGVEDIEQLNREAGARYVVNVFDPEEARPILKHLIENGLDINSMNKQGDGKYTALHAAAITNNPEGAKLLLEMGADAGLTNDKGQTPLELARFSDAARPDEDYGRVIEVLEEAS